LNKTIGNENWELQTVNKENNPGVQHTE